MNSPQIQTNQALVNQQHNQVNQNNMIAHMNAISQASMIQTNLAIAASNAHGGNPVATLPAPTKGKKGKS